MAEDSGDFTIEQGEPAWFERTADSGLPIKRAFCPTCGSPVFLIPGHRPHMRVVYAGSLDDPSGFEPARDIYVASAQPWDVMHPDTPKHEGMP